MVDEYATHLSHRSYGVLQFPHGATSGLCVDFQWIHDHRNPDGSVVVGYQTVALYIDVSRTALIIDAAAMAALDAALAERVTRWGALSAKKTEHTIDALVEQIDAGALRRSRAHSLGRDVEFGSPCDEPGFTSMWARLYAQDAVRIEQRVDQMARAVCESDPRTLAERRADALTALADSIELACACRESDCAGGQSDEASAKTAMVYVIAEEESVHTADRESAHCSAPPAYVFGGGIMPTPLLGAILERATFREVRHPGDAPPEPRYTPSRNQAEFVRCRDLTCRFPGADKPAQFCDLDHTVPYPVGPTHLKGLTVVSNELADDSDPSALEVVGAGLVRDLQTRLDSAFFGNTVANGPSGLESLSGVQHVDAGSVLTDLDAFAEALSLAEQVGATLTAFVMNPATLLSLATLKVAETWNQPLLGIDPSSPTKRSAQGVPVHWSPSVPEDTIWGIPRAKVFAVLRVPASVVTDRSAYFSSDRLGVRCVTRWGFAYPHEAAIVKIGIGGS